MSASRATLSVVMLGFLSTAPVFASFELALIADNHDNTFANIGIHRYDVNSGVYLGKITGFASSITSMALHVPSNTLFVRTLSQVVAVNYNTGERIAAFNTPGINSGSVAISNDGNTLFLAINTSAIAKLDPMTGAGLGQIVAPTAVKCIATDPLTGNLIAASYTTSGSTNFLTTYSFDSNNALVGTGTQVSLGTAAANSALPGYFGGAAKTFGFGTTGSGFSFRTFNYATGTTTHFLSSSLAAGETPAGFAPTHTGSLILYRGASPGVYAMDVTGTYRQFGVGTLSNPMAIATVVAPEPATMLALAIPLGALLRRSRSKVRP